MTVMWLNPGYLLKKFLLYFSIVGSKYKNNQWILGLLITKLSAQVSKKYNSLNAATVHIIFTLLQVATLSIFIPILMQPVKVYIKKGGLVSNYALVEWEGTIVQ